MLNFGGEVTHTPLCRGPTEGLRTSHLGPPAWVWLRELLALVSPGVSRQTGVMPASLKRIRESMSVIPTARDKGLTLTIKVTAYDNGMVEVDGIPINESPAYDQGGGWLGAADVITTTLNEFRRQADVRRKQLGT